MKNNEKIKELDSYEVIKHQWIEEVNSDGWLLKHKKTGAKVVLLSNDDDNKVFNIGFRTPVSDDTGVPHIIEHTVLCGSDRFPVKDPFMELAKGSLNTFLNAMTYPDKTVYPVASYNEQDFKNLMHVYMDAVLHPNIYKEEKIFKQEGWHYELENKDADLIYNGIVYNEMKGVYSSVDGIIDRVTLQSLFPDNGYSNESGGAPEFIPELTYEQYLEFHRRYYHPSNSYIYLYGDMDMAERLQWMDQEYLSGYEALEIDSSIPLQPAFEAVKEVRKAYSITDSETLEDNTVLTLNHVIGTSLDAELNIAFQVLEYALMEMPGAPLKQALIDAGIGKDVYGQYEDDIYQPVYSIVAKYANECDKERFVQIVKNTLEKIVADGLDKKSLQAGLSSLEFKIREADFGRYPKGLMFGLQLMSSWLYDDYAPFVLLETDKIFEKLKAMIDTDYYEKLVRKYLIENTHKSVVTLVPEKGLTTLKENKLAEKLAAKKASMTDDEIEKLVRETAELKAYQEEPSTEEELKCIPLLKISDINPNPRPMIGQKETIENVVMLYNDLFTNGIGYMDIIFDCSDIPEKYQNYMGLLKHVLSYMDTDQRKYTDLNTDINLNLGGFAFDAGLYVNSKTDKTIFTAEIHAKMLYEKIDKVFEFIKEIVLHTKLDDEKRLKEILEELKSRVQSSITQSGDSAAMLRAMSYYSKPYYLKEQTVGISFYKFIEDILDHYEEKKDEVISMLKETIKYAFRKDRIMVNYAGDRDSFNKVKELTVNLREKMYSEPEKTEEWEFVPNQKNEGIKTSGQVQYVARTGNYNKPGEKADYNGSLAVLGNIMRCEYLWNNIRVLGGAYGCNCLFNRSGDVMFTSYRDPNLTKTSDTFLNAPDYIRNFTADERQMRKFIIGTISSMDTPLGASDRSLREFSHFITEMDYETLKRERAKILSTTEDDIRELAPLIEAAMKQNNICVVGSQSSIDEAGDLFQETKNLA
ncbi:MAG: insulinase family protein [Eubacterium sp.]